MHSKSLLLSLLLVPIPAMTQGPGGGPPQPRPAFKALDADHDGMISAAEIAAAANNLLAIDVNHDGQLTSLEFLPSQSDPNANKPDETIQRLMLLDKNGDGILTKNEVPERMQGIFERADKDKDGRLTAEELRSSASTQRGPNGRAMSGPDATRMDPILHALDLDKDGVISAAEIAAAPNTLKILDKDGDGAISAAEVRPRQMTPADRSHHFFDEWDTNKDGRIVKEEAPDRMQQVFETIDTNHDGAIDDAEATTYFANMPQQRGPGGQAAPAGPGGQGRRGEGGGPEGARPAPTPQN